MPYIEKRECVKYQEVVVVNIYTDRITAHVLKKNADGISLMTSAFEYQENGEMNEEKIKINCQKVLQALPHEQFTQGKPIVFILGPGISECVFVSVDAKRERKEMVISEVELNSITEKSYVSREEDTVIFKNFPMRFLVDGFAVPSPVGLNGQNITSHLVSVVVPRSLESVFSKIASEHGLHYAGMMDMCQVLSDSPMLLGECADGVFVAVFQNETILILMREQKCVSIGKMNGGYGILEQEVSKIFAVGLEEAKGILRAGDDKHVRESVARAIEEMTRTVVFVLIERIKAALGKLDPEHLLPSAFFIGQFGYLPRISQALIDDMKWLAGAPIARNPDVRRVNLGAHTIRDDIKTFSRVESSGDAIILTALLT